MALAVTNSKKKYTVSVTTNNGGMQGSSFNPQKTAPVQTTSNPQKTAPASTLQNTYNPQTVATAQQVQAIAEAQKRAVEAELIRQKQARKDSFTTSVGTAISTKASQLRVSVGSNPNLQFRKTEKGIVNAPVRTEYESAYEKAYAEALAEFDSKVSTKKSGFSKLWDKVTFGEDRRGVEARKYAETRAQQIQETDFADYEVTVNDYIAKQANAQAKINKAAQTMSQAEFDVLIASEQALLDQQYSVLQKKAANYEGRMTAFTELAGKPLTSFGSKALNKVLTSVDSNPLFKYTLGSGGKNLPSIVTAPSRVINFFGNLNTKDRDIYQYGGGSVKRTESGDNAWQATQNQRNFNLRPWTDREFNKDDALKWINGESFGDGQYKNSSSGSLQNFSLKNKYRNAKTDADKEAVLREAWAEYNRSGRMMNSGKELALDPMNLIGGTGITSKLLGKAKNIKFVSKLDDLRLAQLAKFNQTKVGKATKWLTSEYESVQMRKTKFVEQELDDIARKKPAVKGLLDKWQANKGQIKAGVKSELTREVVADFAGFSNSQVKIFQKFFDAGDWTFKNASRVKNKEKYVELAKKYAKIFDDLQQVENKKGIATPYRQKYLPHFGGKWSTTVRKFKKKLGVLDDDWWFTKEKKQGGIQSRRQLIGSVSARKYYSKVARKDFPILKDVVAGREDIGRNIDRINAVDSFVKPTKFERISRIAGAPGRLWKKAVLLGNPAWYVNNELFNQVSGISAGGLKFLKNQRGTGKYLKHISTNAKGRYMPSKANQIVRDIGSNITKETGGSFLSKLASKQENRARVALYRTFRQKGMNHASAVKKLNRNLFDYSTKNWERPIKAVVPFWSFQKNVAKRAVTLPFESPKTAIAYNRVDRHQKQQFEEEFASVIPELKKQGYSDEEIADIKKEQSKYYSGKLMAGRDKNGNARYINTPFNAFSEKSTGNLGINPFLSALNESAQSEDQFKNKLSGGKTSFISRVLSKFPAVNLGMQFKDKIMVDRGIIKPTEKYIGKAGSEGYGLGKEKQGFDSSKENYVASMDPRTNFVKNVLSFAGVPRSTTFDKTKLLESKKLQKVTQTYFDTDWKSMSFEDQQAGQKTLFDKYGISADDFYKGVLAKYDTENTKNIKSMKETARTQNQKLLDEYSAQPEGTRGAWAVKKMHELADSGYFDSNPFLYSFVKGGNADKTKGWMSPASIEKSKISAQKRVDYQYASSTGDWSKWRDKYGVKSEKARLYQLAQKTGDWTQYRKTFGQKSTPFQHEGKFFKTAETMQKYKEGSFWKKYAEGSKSERRQLLAENPEYNRRKDWTTEQWQTWKDEQKALELQKASKITGFTSFVDRYRDSNRRQASVFLTKKQRKTISFKYKLS